MPNRSDESKLERACRLAGSFEFVKNSPFPPPGGGWPRRGRETAPAGACGEQPPKAALGERRNAGGNPRVTEIFRPPPDSDLCGGLRNGTDFQISARIPLQSENRFRRAGFLTASPRGKRLGAPAPEGSSPHETEPAGWQARFLCSRGISAGRCLCTRASWAHTGRRRWPGR